MPELEDPLKIYRESLANLTPAVELHPPTIERAEVWPYPELQRLWVRVQITPFASFPNLALTVTGPDGGIVTSMFIVEAREPYQSLTLHLRQPPRAGERYALDIELSRDDQVLDTRRLDFDLVFREPKV